MERPRDLPDVDPSQACVDDRSQRIVVVEDPRVVSKRQRPCRRIRARSMLEPDSRLPFERDRTRESQKRRRRVEQPAGGCGDERADVRVHDPARQRVLRRKAEWIRGEIRKIPEAGKEAGRRLHRKTCGRVAAWQTRFPEMRDARQLAANTSGKYFPSPDRALVAVSGAIE